VVVLAWQDMEQVTTISTYHRMCVAINKGNQEQTRPVVVCDYNVNTLEKNLEDQMLQLYLLE
jgi:hypothetical protein